MRSDCKSERTEGSGAILAISEQLQKELPRLKGFGESSIKNMRQFYEQWCEYIIRQPMAGELQQADLQEDINRQPTAGEMQLSVTHLNFQPPVRLDLQSSRVKNIRIYNPVS